jgi:prefoldin subunit 5
MNLNVHVNVTVDFSDRVMSLLAPIPQLSAAVRRLEKIMDQFGQDMTDLQSAVADVATDVKNVAQTLTDLRTQLASAGVNPGQLQTLESQISALRQAHTDLSQAAGGAPVGGGTPGTPAP